MPSERQGSLDPDCLGADVGGTDPSDPSLPASAAGGGDYRSPRSDQERYERRATLGEGGMGEVLLCRDRRIGRDVAMKVALRSRDDGADLRARFATEARVQGQLEHPAIVPVYDFATDATGRAFFTMKRVRGLTLETILGQIAGGDPEVRAEYTRHRLLAAFERVCLAIDFAHARGVVHRDLKPSNVMLGDFGEVYVLDWGVAKVGVDEHDGSLEESGERPCAVSNVTEDGLVLGTPAYMAPEQWRGDPANVRTDVYALGAILFELLTTRSVWECRHGAVDDFERAELEADVPPELSAVWRRATAYDPNARHASARELHDDVERFLSGDRDLATRKALVADHLAAATSIRSNGTGTADERARVLAEVGRAIALDPNDGEAMRMLVELLGDAPKRVPAEVEAELERSNEDTRQYGRRRAIMAYTLPPLLFFLPWLAVMGIKSVVAAAVVLGSFVMAGIVAAIAHQKTSLTKHVPWVTLASSIAMATSAVLSGVFVLLPTFVIGNTICHAVACRRRHRRLVVLFGVLAILIPMSLELFGILPRSWELVAGALVIHGHAFELREPFAPLFLMLANVGFLLFTARYIGHFREAMRRAELARLAQLWQLRQLVPERVRSATSEHPEGP